MSKSFKHTLQIHPIQQRYTIREFLSGSMSPWTMSDCVSVGEFLSSPQDGIKRWYLFGGILRARDWIGVLTNTASGSLLLHNARDLLEATIYKLEIKPSPDNQPVRALLLDSPDFCYVLTALSTVLNCRNKLTNGIYIFGCLACGD